jgi:hypothetical protein
MVAKPVGITPAIVIRLSCQLYQNITAREPIIETIALPSIEILVLRPS